MSNLAKLQTLGMVQESTDLQKILLALTAFGHPNVYSDADGWQVSVDMHVAAAGTSFKIRSEFRHPTPIAAAQQCASRVQDTLKQWL